MKDIKISNDGLAFENGDLVLIDGVDRVVQNIWVALRTLKNDWLLNHTKGINYFNHLKSLDDVSLRAEIKTAVREVVGVEKITRFEFKRQGTIIKIRIGVQIYGENRIISGDLNYGN